MTMQSSFAERVERTTEKTGWTVERVTGYIDGENLRDRNHIPSSYHIIGTDQYSRGYRDGYFRQTIPDRRVVATTGLRDSERRGA